MENRCTKCSGDPVYFRKYSGERLCSDCFSSSIIEKARKTIKKHKMLKYGVEYACIQYPKYLDYFHKDIKNFESRNEEFNMPFHNWSDLELYLSFHHYLGTRLSVGMADVTDILFYDIKKLHVSGFSFYAHKGGHDWMPGIKPEGYFLDDYNKEKHTFINHAQIPQMKLLRALQTLDNRLSFDVETEEILQKYKV